MGLIPTQLLGTLSRIDLFPVIFLVHFMTTHSLFMRLSLLKNRIPSFHERPVHALSHSVKQIFAQLAWQVSVIRDAPGLLSRLPH